MFFFLVVDMFISKEFFDEKNVFNIEFIILDFGVMYVGMVFEFRL